MRSIAIFAALTCRIEPWLAPESREWLHDILNEAGYAAEDRAGESWVVGAMIGCPWGALAGLRRWPCWSTRSCW
jgi:hypothetical protein